MSFISKSISPSCAEASTNSAGADALSARLGGDEFAMIAPPGMSEDAVLGLAKQIGTAVPRPILYEDKSLQVGVSVGIAFSDANTTSAHDVCTNADQAMYVAKSRKDAQPVVFDPSQFAPRPTLEVKTRLEEALRLREIRPWSLKP